MPIYPDQANQMLASAPQLAGASQYQQHLPAYSPEIASYEQLVRLLPSLPLNPSERSAITRIIQGHLQRTAQQQP